MEGKQNISQYRKRMDKTLASCDLANEEALKALVKNQLICSSEHAIEEDIDNVSEKRTKEVWNFIEMLRSTSTIDKEVSRTGEMQHAGWKLKQDYKEYRVMYREGPQGTPFHSLLVEGYVDGPVDVCLCVSWESSLYKKWWPQFTIPTFKILNSKYLQKIRINEQISLVRMKLSWPLSAREAVVHYFEFEYFQDDLILVLLNSISDSENIDESTHGSGDDGTPEPKDIVRIDVFGGFAIQKVTPDRSYFRTIANMDIKLDFVPPSLINFISRQLVGSGFRLYQKIVASACKGDGDFSEALGGLLYARIREALFSNGKPKEALALEDLKIDGACIHPEGSLVSTDQNDVKDISDEHATDSPLESAPFAEGKTLCEIEEEEIEEKGTLEGDSKGIDPSPINPSVVKDCNGIDLAPISQIAEKCPVNDKDVCISPKVEQALGTLEEIISVIREFGYNAQTKCSSMFSNEGLNLQKDAVKGRISSDDGRLHSNGEVCVKPSEGLNLEKDVAKGTISSDDDRIHSNGEACIKPSEKETLERISAEPKDSSSTHDFRIAPASPEQNLSSRCESQQVKGTAEAPMLNKTADDGKQENSKANGIREINLLDEQQKSNRAKRHRFCCLHLICR